MIEYQVYDVPSGDSDLYNIEITSAGNAFYVNTDDDMRHDIVLNGQTMLNTTPTFATVGNFSIATNAGYVYTLNGRIYFDIPVSGKDKVFYNLKETNDEPIFALGETHEELTGNFSAAIADVSTYNIYLNGVKLSSGSAYSASSIGEFLWIDSDQSITGTLFAVDRNTGMVDATGFYDVHYNYFLKNCNTLNINGVRYPQSYYFQGYSGLSFDKLATGLSMKVEKINQITSFKI